MAQGLRTTRTRSVGVLLLVSLAGCPKQELAALNPCTVSAVSEQINQAGIAEVDLLFVIDNSASMATEQVKLAKELPRLVEVLTSGDRFAGATVPGDVEPEQRYFTKVRSLHLGVVSTNLGGIDEPADGEPEACAGLGDDGKLLRSTDVAVAGVTALRANKYPGFMAGETVLLADPACDLASLAKYQTYEAGEDPTPEVVAHTFSCISRLGVDGCAFEQQLEAMWKALAPSEGKGDQVQFLNGSKGHGDGFNKGFLRDDAILAVIHVSDEEDCSIKLEGKDLFRLTPEANARFGSAVNVRCGMFGESQQLLWPAERYIEGLKSLKPERADRIIFAAIVGIPEEENGSRELDAVLAHPDMQFRPLTTSSGLVPTPSCFRERDGRLEEATPPRRFIEVAQGFADAQVVWSICSEDYGPALDRLIDRIASKLTGNCLPRQLTRNERGLVACDVFELLPPGATRCAPERGHTGKPSLHGYRGPDDKREKRLACRMEQVPIDGRQPQRGARGWYYDDFAKKLETECETGTKQRISFQFADNATDLPPGAGAVYECFQSVPEVNPDARGRDAVNTPCPTNEANEAICEAKSNADDGGYELVCVDQVCQIACEESSDCPDGWVCATRDNGQGKPPRYCQLPTCPQQRGAGEDTRAAKGS